LVRTENAIEQTPTYLNHTKWVSINLEDRKNTLKSNKKGHIDGKLTTQKKLQEKIPTYLKNENTKTLKAGKHNIPVVPYQYANKVSVVSPLST